MTEPGGAFSVDLGALEDIVSGIAKFDQSVEQRVADVDSRISALHVDWAGDAATAQKANHDRWMHGVAEMREALDTLRTAARQAHGNYGAAIDAVTGMWP